MLKQIFKLFNKQEKKKTNPKLNVNIVHTLGFMEIQDELNVLLVNPQYVNFESLFSIHNSFLNGHDEYRSQYTKTLEYEYLSKYIAKESQDILSQIESSLRKKYKL